MNKRIFLIAFLLLTVGCSSNKSNTTSYGSGSSSPQVAPAPAAPAAAAPEALDLNNSSFYFKAEDESGRASTEAPELASGRQTQPNAIEDTTKKQKIILNSSLEMATERFDYVATQIRNITDSFGGYVQNSMQYNSGNESITEIRTLDITLRIPSESYEAAMSELRTLGKVRSANENQENVTAQYYDTQSRLETKLIEEERLLDLIQNTTKIEDILKLEELLGQTRMQIEIYQNQLTNIDRLSAFSTITVYLQEVLDESAVVVPTNLFGKISESFIKSLNATIHVLESLAIALVALSVPAFVILVAICIILTLFRLTRKKS